MQTRGTSLISVLVATVILAGSFTYFLSFLQKRRELKSDQSRKLVLTGLAAELAELFRSHTQDSFTNFLRAGSRAQFFYCAHINLLNRASNQMMNPDGIADLPDYLLQRYFTLSPQNVPNRFFQVTIVNLRDNLTPRANICSQRFSATLPTADERYLITIGVTWSDPRSDRKDLDNVSISTLIPDQINYDS